MSIRGGACVPVSSPSSPGVRATRGHRRARRLPRLPLRLSHPPRSTHLDDRKVRPCPTGSRRSGETGSPSCAPPSSAGALWARASKLVLKQEGRPLRALRGRDGRRRALRSRVARGDRRLRVGGRRTRRRVLTEASRLGADFRAPRIPARDVGRDAFAAASSLRAAAPGDPSPPCRTRNSTGPAWGTPTRSKAICTPRGSGLKPLR